MRAKVNDRITDEFGWSGTVIQTAEFDDWIKIHWDNGIKGWIMTSVSVEAIWRDGERIL